jgi:hypothetical protein
MGAAAAAYAETDDAPVAAAHVLSSASEERWGLSER